MAHDKATFGQIPGGKEGGSCVMALRKKGPGRSGVARPEEQRGER